ncbi:EAL domain-containing protein [Aeromonas veronii]
MNSKYMSFVNELRRGVNEHEFIPFFQPLVCAKTKKIIGIEVLMRWRHPEKGLILPDYFIHEAELSGLIIDMTSILIKSTINFLNVNKHHFLPGFQIAFNITSLHFESEQILNDCHYFQSVCGMNGWRLSLELTERCMLNDTFDVMNSIHRLAFMGVYLSLDDFGTGYSGLKLLQKIKFNSIKIDRSFVSGIGRDEVSERIVDSVIITAKKMRLMLVAEGVETKEQEKYLCDHGVNVLQGYLYGKPMSPKGFIDFLLSPQ